MASYEQNKKNKKWSVRFRIIENGTEKNKRLSGFERKKEAEQAYIQYMKEYDRKKELKKEPEKILFSEIYEQYFESARQRLKVSSLCDMESAARIYILPKFGDIMINNIKPIEILEWQNSIEKSYRYRCKIRGILSSIFNFAERYYDIPSPMSKVENIKNNEPKKEMSFWTEEEFSRFIKVVDNKIYRALFTMLYITGCRIGEALALHKDDIHKDDKYIDISKSITSKGNNTWQETTPKNQSSNRKLYIPDYLIDELLEICNMSDGNYIFFGKRPLSFPAIRNNLKKYCLISGVKKIRIHDLRHSCASLLISHGVSIVAVAKRLGHASIEQTLNTYSHMLPRDEDMIKTVFDNMQIPKNN